jgi:predicted nucleic acid-binding protein
MRSSRRSTTGAEQVADTSVIVYLAATGHLDLLDPLTTVVPPAVVGELLRGPPDAARAAIEADWGLRCSRPRGPPLVAGLGAGESEVIALAHAESWRAILDDAAARARARALGVRVIGTLGVVLEAVKDGRVAAAVPVIRAIRAAGFRISNDVVREALARTTGEPWGS